MADYIPQQQDGKNQSILDLLISLLTGKGGQDPNASYATEPTPQPTPQQTPQASPMPTVTPTNSEILQRMSPSPTPGPQAGMHPMQQLQMAKAGMPNPMQEDESKKPMMKGKSMGRA